MEVQGVGTEGLSIYGRNYQKQYQNKIQVGINKIVGINESWRYSGGLIAGCELPHIVLNEAMNIANL